MERSPLIERWAAARSLPAHSWNGRRLTLTVDSQYRIYVNQAPSRKLAIEARICDLPTDRAERERLIEHVLQVATARMRQDACMLAVDALESALQLQAEVPADTDEQGLSDAVERFINSLAFWRKVVR